MAEAALFTNDDIGPEERKGQKSDSAYRTISEVATDLGLPQHVLRFWETKFKQISPLKRGGGRRYYRPQDVDLIRRIHYLLHTQGYTIKGVQKLLLKDRMLQNNVPVLLENGDARVVVSDALQRAPVKTTQPVLNETSQADLAQLLNRLKEMRSALSDRC